MITRKAALIAYAAFLAGFSAFKYLSAAPEVFSVQYAVSVCILVVLTGILPFVVAAGVAGRLNRSPAKWGAAIVTSLLVCCAGYAAYWALFIEPSGADVPMIAVASRGIYAGLIEGILSGLFANARRT